MKKRSILALTLALALLVLPGCSLFGGDKDDPEGEGYEEEGGEYPVSIGGALIQSRPGTVVSLSPSLTEQYNDLGLIDRLVGVSDYCDSPGQVLDLPTCGTAQQPDLAELEDLAPHIVVTQTPLSDRDTASLEQLDIQVVVLPPAKTVNQWRDSYMDIARLMEGGITGAQVGDAFVSRLNKQLTDLQNTFGLYAQINGAKRAAYLRLLDFTVATGDTLVGALMEEIGLDNIAADQSGWDYPETDDRRQAFESLDILYMDSRDVTISDLEAHDFYRTLQVVIQDEYLYVDADLLERQCLRMLEQLQQMGMAAYPDAELSEDLESLFGIDEEEIDLSDDPMFQALENMPGADGER